MCPESTARGPRRRLSVLGAAAVLTAALAFSPGLAGEASAGTLRAEIELGLVAALDGNHNLRVEAMPLAGEGILALSRRLCGSTEAVPRIAELNGGVRSLKAGVRYRVPYEVLRPELQLQVVKALFDQDSGIARGWSHTAKGVGDLRRESLWHLARWFTGNGENFNVIRSHNGLDDDDLDRGETVTIPAHVLLPAFRASLPPLPDGRTYNLEYGGDQMGEYAVYRLRAGEALYSSVVVRFTGRLLAVDVNALAAEIAGRSAIDDVTEIAVGYRVKVPFDLLLPEYLPPGHARRRVYEESLRASGAFSNRIRARDLAGITVILDPGHGGRDVGASMSGVWESLYVYDVALRVKKYLETYTAARVVPTVRDGAGFEIDGRDVLPVSRGHAILTDPPYSIEDSKIGVNLRWYLANSVYRRAIREHSRPEQVIFLSIHADSLHPSLRGMTAYIPGASLSGGKTRRTGPVYARTREVSEGSRVSFPMSDRVRSEGLSRQLANKIVESFGAHQLTVHSFKPVREKIIRKRSEFVPAVLRYNAVPAKALIEVCNLANEDDRKLLRTRAFRQQVAEAIVEGILSYYGRGEAGEEPPVVRAAR